MKLLSWDVGIYNLSYCILEKNDENKEIKIIDWNIVNLVDSEKMKKDRNALFENIPRKLHELPQLLDVDCVVIENQPSLKNPQMKSIQMILYSYFLILGKVIGNSEITKSYIQSIDFCSASNKLKVYDGPKIVLPEKKSRTKKKNEELIGNKIEVTIDEDNTDNKNIEIISIIPIIQEKEDDKKTKSSSVKYADKKRLAIEHALYYLKKDQPNYFDFFNNHKKKDDLADSFLQGLYYLKK
jgi:hypothetical protein